MNVRNRAGQSEGPVLSGNVDSGDALMSELSALERIELALTRCHEEAAPLGDELLDCVIRMAILHVRRKKAGKAVGSKQTSRRLVAA